MQAQLEDWRNLRARSAGSDEATVVRDLVNEVIVFVETVDYAIRQDHETLGVAGANARAAIERLGVLNWMLSEADGGTRDGIGSRVHARARMFVAHGLRSLAASQPAPPLVARANTLADALEEDVRASGADDSEFTRRLMRPLRGPLHREINAGDASSAQEAAGQLDELNADIERINALNSTAQQDAWGPLVDDLFPEGGKYRLLSQSAHPYYGSVRVPLDLGSHHIGVPQPLCDQQLADLLATALEKVGHQLELWSREG
jgi:hypothetical protein